MGIRSGYARESSNLKLQGKKAAREATSSPILENLMRLGYVVRGLVYGVIGVLALQVAIGHGGGLKDTQGAIASLGQSPLGSTLLYIVLAGLIGYAIWGLVRAALDLQPTGASDHGTLARIGYALSGLSYGFLAYSTYGLIAAKASAAHNGAQGAQTQQAAASILTNSWGPWVVGLAGLIVMGIGVSHLMKGLGHHFPQQFQAYSLSGQQRTFIERLGRFGTAARGVVFGMIGLFLLIAAYHRDPSQAKGIDGVLTALLHQPYGPFLLGIVALGLIAFACYSVMSGFWLRLKAS